MTRPASSVLRTWVGVAENSSTTVPSARSTRVMTRGSMRWPWLASVEYAAAMSSTDTSPAPRTIDGTGGSSGVGFLQKALDLTFFPELYAVRTEIGS